MLRLVRITLVRSAQSENDGLSRLRALIAVAGSLRRLPIRPKQPGTSKGATTNFSRVLEVRIHLPPAESPRTIGSCPTLQVGRRYPDSFPLLHGHEFGHCAIEHGSIRKLGMSSKPRDRHDRSVSRRGTGSEKLRINPRETWYSNIEALTPNGDYEVTLHLKQPRPGRYRQGLATPARRAVGSAAGDSKNTAGPACIRMREALVTAGAHSENTGAA